MSVRFLWIALCLLAVAPGCRRARPAAPVSRVVLAGSADRERILRGVYPGEEGWRWTAPRFAVALDPPAANPAWFDMDFTVPDELLERAPAATVVATAGGVEIARETYRKPGRYSLSREIRAPLAAGKPAEIEIGVDRSFTDGATSREQGLIVFSVALAPHEATADFRDAEAARSREAYAETIRQRNLALPPEKQRDLMRLFHDLPIWNSMWYQDVRIIKNPLDLWMLQQIAWEVRPDFVVETGTWQGGSALWWAHTLSAMGLDGARVVTVDVQNLTAVAAAHPIWKERVDFRLGDSADPRLVARIAKRVLGARVIVNLDSDHSMEHVLKELRLYGPLVSRGSYIAVEDTHLDGVPTHPEQGPGPLAAVRRFLEEGGSKDFEQDFTREAMVMTSYPGGWLRRK